MTSIKVLGLAAFAVMVFAASASAQSVIPDPSTCTDVQVGGKRFMRCPDGHSYEWQTINNRSVLVRIQTLTNPYDADRLRDAERYQNQYGYYYAFPDTRFGRDPCERRSQITGRPVISERCDRARRGY